ncbi:MAG: hypothetical protein GX591_11615 [Planctomycetes bacterium]|nr:hypothetical protein [Planctomycetota bacterium]
MQTLRYRLTRRPCNLDDHVAMAVRGSCGSAEVVCVAQEVLHEAGAFWQWVAQVRFALPDGPAMCEVVCGATRADAAPEVRRRDAGRADRRLAVVLERLRRAGLSVAPGATFQGNVRHVPASRLALWDVPEPMACRDEML